MERYKNFAYNQIMRVFLIAVLLVIAPMCFGAEDLSKQATAFYSDNNYNKAMELILQIDEKERTAQDWLLLGNVLEDRGEYSNAVFMYQKAINTDPKYYKAYYNLGNNCAENSRFNTAIANYKKAISLNKENPFIFYNLACVYMETGELKKAKTNLNKAIVLKSDVPEFHYNLAYVYKKLNKPKLAQTYLDNFNKLAYPE